MRLIDADQLKAHYAWLDCDTMLTRVDVDAIVDAQPTVTECSIGYGICLAHNDMKCPRMVGEND